MPVLGNFLAVLQILVDYFNLSTITVCHLTEDTVLRPGSGHCNVIITSATILTTSGTVQRLQLTGSDTAFPAYGLYIMYELHIPTAAAL